MLLLSTFLLLNQISSPLLGIKNTQHFDFLPPTNHDLFLISPTDCNEIFKISFLNNDGQSSRTK